MRTLLIVFAWVGCGSSREQPATGNDSGDAGAVIAPSSTGGRRAPEDDGPKPSAGSGGSRTAPGPDAGEPNKPAADSGTSPGPVESASEFDAGSDPDRNKVTAAQLCERIATINCAGEAYCCDNPGRTLEACKQDLLSTCSSTLKLDRIAMHPSVRFNAEAAEKAFAELERRVSECDPSVAQWGGSTDGLRGILRGSVESKASCMPAATIDPVEVGAALASCAQPETHACVYASLLDPWTCEPRSTSGGGCVTDNNCTDGLYCVVNTPGIAGVCQQRKASGQSCAAPTECASLYCKKSLCVDADQQAAYCLVN